MVQNIMFDLNLVHAENVQNLFHSVFATLPMVKAIKFYSSWCASNHWNTTESEIICVKSMLIEIPLMIEHFFTSMGLEVQNMLCAEFVSCFFTNFDLTLFFSFITCENQLPYQKLRGTA